MPLFSAASQPQVAPMWLEDQAGAASEPIWGWLIWGGTVAAVLVLVALGATIRAERLRRDPGGHALRAVARRLGADRRLLQELGQLASPDGRPGVLSMLVSDHALRTGVQSSGKPPTARVARLMGARGVSLPATDPPGKPQSGTRTSARPTPRADAGR